MDMFAFFLIVLKSSFLSTGGLGPLPMLHNDFIARGWATEREFTEALAVGQSSPGPNGLWVVSFGYLTAGLPGAIIALLALLIPPFTVLAVERVYARLAMHSATQGFLDGMALAIAGTGFVIFAQLIVTSSVDWRALVIFSGALGLAMVNRVPVIAIIALAAVAGAALDL